MTFKQAVKRVCELTGDGMEIDARPYMTRGVGRITVYLNRLYSVVINDFDGARHVLSTPFSPHLTDIFANDWRVCHED